jgi:hypothetical protein
MPGDAMRSDRERKKKENSGSHVWRGKWRASRNGGWEWEFGGVWKMEVYIEALLELVFCPKPPNFGVEVHMEALAGVALRTSCGFQNFVCSTGGTLGVSYS